MLRKALRWVLREMRSLEATEESSEYIRKDQNEDIDG